MGGHAAGEVASKLVIGSLERLDEDRPLGDMLYALRNAVEEANHDLAGAIAGDKKLEGMGTTLTALRFTGRQVGLVHVGDSRAYLLRNGHLTQITHDDTYVQSLVDSGPVDGRRGIASPRKSVILRALMGSDVEPDVSIREARPATGTCFAPTGCPTSSPRPPLRRRSPRASRKRLRTGSSTWPFEAAGRTT